MTALPPADPVQNLDHFKVIWETETFPESPIVGKMANPPPGIVPNSLKHHQGEAGHSDTCSTADSRDGNEGVPEGASPMKVSLQGGRGRALAYTEARVPAEQASATWGQRFLPAPGEQPGGGQPPPGLNIPTDHEGQDLNIVDPMIPSKNPRWWHKYPLVQACLVSRFPICLLPYPPYKLRDLKNCPTKYVLVDAKFLALQIVSTQTFSAGKKRTLDLADLLALDAHLERCRLTTLRTAGFWQICEAAKKDGKQWEMVTQMRREATIELEKLKQIQEIRLASLPEEQKKQLCSNRKLRRDQHQQYKQTHQYNDEAAAAGFAAAPGGPSVPQPAMKEPDFVMTGCDEYPWSRLEEWLTGAGSDQDFLESRNKLWGAGYPTPAPAINYNKSQPPTSAMKGTPGPPPPPPALPKQKAPGGPPPAPTTSQQEKRGEQAGNDITDKLERLVTLHATGAITDKEFAQAKSLALGM